MNIHTSTKWLPLLLIGLGIVMVSAAITVSVLQRSKADSSTAPLPTQMAGYSLSSESTGNAAVQEFEQLHGKSFPVRSGGKAVYGPANQVILWVAGTDTPEEAQKLLVEMRDKIAEGRSPFQPSGVQTIANHAVYALDGMGQKHFYFQSRKHLIWLAANADVADQALQQALIFYP